MPAPLKKIKSGNYEVSIWENEKDMNDGGIVTFKTISLKKSWKDKNNVTREQYLSLRKQDVEKVLVLMRKVHEHLILEEEKWKKRKWKLKIYLE